MEAIKNAIWGESTPDPTKEPVSGETGSGTATDPHDKGNLEEQEQSTTAPAAESSPTETKPAGPIKSDLSTESELPKDIGIAERDTTNTATTTSDGPSNAQKDIPGESVLPDPTSAQKPEQKQQGADRPEEEPTSSGADAVKQSKAEAEESQKQTFEHDPDDHSGKPLGTVKHQGSEEEGEGQVPTGASEKKGTGTEYVKSTGLAADGGDFDAAKPGAGREADRLLEEKGITRSDKGLSSDPDEVDPVSAPSKEGKVSLSTKLKEKLHIGSGKH